MEGGHPPHHVGALRQPAGAGRVWQPTPACLSTLEAPHEHKELTMKSILLWAIGVPIPIILLLWLIF